MSNAPGPLAEEELAGDGDRTLNQSEGVALADALREPNIVLKADPRTNAAETLADRQQRIGQFLLAEAVPHAIRVHFETAKNLYLYAWFVYRFYP
jgi:hypothetical protein